MDLSGLYLATFGVKIRKSSEDAITPFYATEGAIAFDIFPLIDRNSKHQTFSILPNTTKLIRTGLHFEVPKGYGLFIYSRSGQGFKNHVTLVNGTGLIDSDYRGEVMVELRNDHPDKVYTYNRDTAIAQGVILEVPRIKFNVVESLTTTKRGEKGFGSTDKEK